MRIIGGKYRGRILETLPGLKTRPTLDMTKCAIFNSLGNYLPGFVTLDVFGGSGALSFESLSRGATKSYIIDNNPDAIDIIKKNANNLKIEKNLKIFYGDYITILPTFVGKTKFDLIFLDPPFRMKVIEELINYIIDNNLLSDGGYIMAEYPIEDVVNKNYSGLEIKLCKRYSSSEILILEKVNI